LEHRHRLADRLDADARRLELSAEAGDRLRCELAQLQVAEPRQRVPVPEARVGAQRRPLEVRAGVDRPPLLDELGERLSAGVDVGERTRALERADLASNAFASAARSNVLLRSALVSSYQRTRQTA
jgi:hypothetical protein